MLIVFLVPELAEVAARIFQLFGHLRERAAGRDGAALTSAIKTAQSVRQNGAQPAAEAAAVRLILEARQLLQQHPENVLEEIIHILGLESGASQPVAQERRVEIDEPLPRLRVGLVAQSLQQAD